MKLDDLIQVSVLEDANTECKARLDRQDTNGWIKTIAGFANASGGTMYIGVEDKTNKLLGFSERDADNERNYFNNQINEHITPRPNLKILFLPYSVREKKLFVIQIQVEESAVKPIIVKYKNIPSIYMRRDGFTNGATYEEIIHMSLQSSRIQFDRTESELVYNRNDFTDLLCYYSDHNNGESLSDKALQSIGFFSSEKKLAQGAVLFRDHYDGNKTEVQCSVFSGFHKGSERIVTVNRYRGNIINSIQYIMDFILQRMNHTIIKEEQTRRNIDAFPQRALFEGIINAIAHRDYYLDGTQIQVDLFRDRLEISSPGSFYQGAQIGKTYDLSNIISKRRNELICDILVKCNVMEAAGTGFDKITDEYQNAPANQKPYIISMSDHFTLVLPDLTYADGILPSDEENITFLPPENSTPHDEKVLSYCYHASRKAVEIAEHLGISDSSYFRKNILENLVQQGYLRKSRNGRAYMYRTDTQRVARI